MKLNWAVFASGRGSNFSNFLKLEPQLKNQSIVCFHSDRECGALELARSHHKSQFVLSPRVETYDQQLLKFLKDQGANSIFLLGYMRILSPNFLSLWKGGIVNLHPSLLPAFKGKDAIKRAFDAQVKELGVSLHEVVEEVDAGRILRQRSVLRGEHDSLMSLESRVHEAEYQLVGEFLFDLDRDESLRLALSQR